MRYGGRDEEGEVMRVGKKVEIGGGSDEKVGGGPGGGKEGVTRPSP